jgi:hypothetical protein
VDCWKLDSALLETGKGLLENGQWTAGNWRGDLLETAQWAAGNWTLGYWKLDNGLLETGKGLLETGQ